MANLSTKYLGLNLKNPIIVGSSGLTSSLDKIKKLEDAGAAAVVLKSLFEEEIVVEMEVRLKQMVANRFIFPETLSFCEDMNDIEDTTEQYLNLIMDAKKSTSIPIIASINCVTADEWTYFPKRIEAAGADALELNLFIIPSDLTRSSDENEKMYFEIIEQVQKQISIPIALKISYYFSNLGLMIQQLSNTGVAGIVLFNRYYSPDFNTNSFDLTMTNVLSSRKEIATPLKWIAIMADRIKCDLAASTGIHSGRDIIKQILAGANATQIVSTLYLNGVDQIQTMLQDLEFWMETKNYDSLDQFRGKMSQANSLNPAAYERVQFMKYFRNFEYKKK